MQIPLTRGTKTFKEARFTDALMVNMLVDNDPVIGSAGYVTNHCGLKRIGEASGTSRGGIYNSRTGSIFRVVDDKLVSINADGTQNAELGIVNGTGQVSMPFSFNSQAVITQQGGFYLYSAENGFQRVTDPDLGEVIDGVWIDGYFFLVDPEAPIVTDLDAENSIRQLNYGSAEIEPDPIRGVDKWRNFAVVFGSTTMEFYDNIGATNFPFQRVESYTIYIGIVGTHAKAKLPKEAGFIILGSSKGEKTSFHFAVNGNATNISTKEIDRILEEYTEEQLSTTYLEYLSDENQEYIYCHLPSHTLIYDITTSGIQGYHQWSIIRTGWSEQKDFKGYWQGINAVKTPQLNDYTWGNRDKDALFVFDRETPLQDDEQQEHILFTPLIKPPQTPWTISKLQPEIVNGRAAINRYESVFMSTTEDGEVYSKEVPFRIQERGARWSQVIWRRIGYFQNWFGAKLRYVGRTNLSLALFRLNDDI